MNILVGCEFSGVVRDACSALGHNSWSCDFLPSETPGNHYQGNILDILYSGQWDLFIVHPTCTYLCNSGVRWLHTEPGRWEKMEQGAKFFRQMLDAPVAMVAAENPIPHKYAVAIIGRKYDQIIQPYQFGHGETKATCLWLKNLPALKPTNEVSGREPRIHHMPPGPNRSHERSRTYLGVANAMALQWAGRPTPAPGDKGLLPEIPKSLIAPALAPEPNRWAAL